MGWIAHKFGGSSLADADCFRRVAAILRSEPAAPMAVVVSAMGGLTNQLFALIDTAVAGRDPEAQLSAIRGRQATTAAALLEDRPASRFLEVVDRDIADIRQALAGVSPQRPPTRGLQDRISGYGELWSARLMAAFLAEGQGGRPGAEFVDAREIIVIEHGEMGPIVAWDESRRRCRERIPADARGTFVITGYIASDKQGEPTTLGRNGSDFSASIVAALLGAEELTIWTDVDGVMSGDPRLVPRRASSTSCPTTRQWSSPISAPRSSIRRPWRRPSRAASRSGSAIPSIPSTGAR
jgi:aspartokinase/homoserine dehydrogenase 1